MGKGEGEGGIKDRSWASGLGLQVEGLPLETGGAGEEDADGPCGFGCTDLGAQGTVGKVLGEAGQPRGEQDKTSALKTKGCPRPWPPPPSHTCATRGRRSPAAGPWGCGVPGSLCTCATLFGFTGSGA